MEAQQPGALEQQQLSVAESYLGTFWHRARSSRVAALLRRQHVTDIVDVGAGAGHLGGWLAEYDPQIRYRFLEPVSALSQRLSDRFGDENLVASSTDIGHAEVVTLLDVIEHIENDQAFLTDLCTNMVHHADVVATVPALPFLYSEWDTKLGHFRRYTKRSLDAAFRHAGFKVVSVSYLFPELLVPAIARKAGFLSGSPSGAEFPDLPTWVDSAAFALCSLTSRLGRLCPLGTSLIVVATKE